MSHRLNVIQAEPVTEEELAALEASRPKTRADCAGGVRPCPYMGCRMHLLTNTRSRSSLSFAGLPSGATDDEVIDRLMEMEHTCALDVVDESPDGLTLEEVGELVGVTRERVRQIERQRSGPKLAAGFEPWFGEVRKIADTVHGDFTPRRLAKIAQKNKRRGAPPGPKSPYTPEQRGAALAAFDAAEGRTTDRTNAARDAVEAMCGRRPTASNIRGWRAKRRRDRLAEEGQITRHRVTKRIVRACHSLRKQGLTWPQVASAVAPDYGREPKPETVRLWVKGFESSVGA